MGGNDFKKRKNISSVVDAIRKKDRYIQKHTEESLIQADKM